MELSKLVSGLSTDLQQAKTSLKSQAGYFSVIPPKYFSESLSNEWEHIVSLTRSQGPMYNAEGKIEKNAVKNTLYHMSSEQCLDIVLRIRSLFEKVKTELEF